MLAFEWDNVTHASAFLLGFTVGIITALRLLNLTFSVSQKVLKDQSEPPLDHSGSVGLPSQQTTEAPSTGEQEHP